MDAARSAGAGGGYGAARQGPPHAGGRVRGQKFFGVSLADEKADGLHCRECFFGPLRPIWHDARQKCLKSAMAGIAQMRQLVRDDVIEADGRLLATGGSARFSWSPCCTCPSGSSCFNLPPMGGPVLASQREPRGNLVGQRFPVEVVQKRFPLRCASSSGEYIK